MVTLAGRHPHSSSLNLPLVIEEQNLGLVRNVRAKEVWSLNKAAFLWVSDSKATAQL